MKHVTYRWLRKDDKRSDDIMSIISAERQVEIAQLRRSYESRCKKNPVHVSSYSKNVWLLHISHYDNVLVDMHLGTGWKKEIHKGFETVYDFKDWIEDRQWRQDVFEKNY